MNKTILRIIKNVSIALAIWGICYFAYSLATMENYKHGYVKGYNSAMDTVKVIRFPIINDCKITIHMAAFKLAKKETLENLMLTEGFSPVWYKCPSGQQTIGFGHALKPGDHLPGRITFEQGYDLLLSDFDQCLTRAEQLGFKHFQALAVAHALYCMGEVTVKKISNFEGQILKYNRYHCGGVMKHSTNLDRQREFELKIFKLQH